MRNLFPPALALLLTLGFFAGTAPLRAELRAEPYLAPAAEPDETAILAPPPAPGSAVEAIERSVYQATRQLEGTPRWSLATQDADRDARVVLGDFGCALGIGIVPSEAPHLVRLLGRLDADVEQATAAVKKHYGRRRPLVGNSAALCVPRSDKLDGSFSYPSGHATQGWASALVLAELAPERAAALLARGRVYGESRIVCGAHWPSDVEAARLAAAALVAVLHTAPAFQADLALARQDLDAARQARGPVPDPAKCRIEAKAAAEPPTSAEAR